MKITLKKITIITIIIMAACGFLKSPVASSINNTIIHTKSVICSVVSTLENEKEKFEKQINEIKDNYEKIG